jgi:phage repressor protein C with HTH and peptisase S24 domain
MKSTLYSKKPRKPKFPFLRRVVGDSMLPVLKNGRIVLAVPGMIAVGKVVVARQNNREVIKRVKSIKQLPEARYEAWLEGDNKPASTDSRSYGPVVEEDVMGMVVWPRLVKIAAAEQLQTDER